MVGPNECKNDSGSSTQGRSAKVAGLCLATFVGRRQ